MRLNFKELGEGKPVIIVHGLFGSLDNWMTIGKSIADFFHVYLIDMRNHGRSPHSKSWDYELMAKDLKGFINDHNIKDPAIIGHSMGGKIAMEYALSHEEHLNKMIVVDIGIKEYEPHHQHILKGLSSLDLKKLKSREAADEELSKYITEPGVRQFLLKGLYRKKNRSFGFRFNLSAINQHIKNVGEATKGNPILLPTLFIRGDDSNYILEEDLPELESLFLNSNIETVKNAGHWVHADQPEELLNLILSFLIYN